MRLQSYEAVALPTADPVAVAARVFPTYLS